jgi:hypothetical protein
MVKEFIHGEVEKFTMENGSKDSNMVMEYGEDSMEIHTLESGDIAKLMVMVCTHGKLVKKILNFSGD